MIPGSNTFSILDAMAYRSLFLIAPMSGSGPTVFGIFNNRDKMAAAARSLRKSGLAKTVFATDIYNRDGGVTNDK